MPGGDRTGPSGQGPMTGRGMGPCGPRPRRMCRQGRGFGRRAGFEAQSLTKEEERKLLEQEKQEIDKRLNELEE